MFICLEKKLTPEVIKSMAARKPERVVCLDEGFAGNDQLKTNAVQTMKTKGVTSFRTVCFLCPRNPETDATIRKFRMVQKGGNQFLP